MYNRQYCVPDLSIDEPLPAAAPFEAALATKPTRTILHACTSSPVSLRRSSSTPAERILARVTASHFRATAIRAPGFATQLPHFHQVQKHQPTRQRKPWFLNRACPEKEHSWAPKYRPGQFLGAKDGPPGIFAIWCLHTSENASHGAQGPADNPESSDSLRRV